MKPEAVFLHCKNDYLKLESLFIVSTNTTVRALYSELSSATCFDRVWQSLGGLYSNILQCSIV